MRSLLHVVRTAITEVRIMFGPYPRCPIPGCDARTFDLETHMMVHHSEPPATPKAGR